MANPKTLEIEQTPDRIYVKKVGDQEGLKFSFEGNRSPQETQGMAQMLSATSTLLAKRAEGETDSED